MYLVRLVLREGWRSVVERVCPYQRAEVAKCLHCSPEKAPCTASEGIYECVKGVLCAEGGEETETSLCPHGALLWDPYSQSLVKCDLCAPTHGYPLCHLENPSAVGIELEDRELDEVGQHVGWFVYGDTPFPLDFLPILPWEARIVSEVLSIFERTKGEFTVDEVLEDVVEEREVPPFTERRVREILRITLSPLGPLSLIKGDEVEEIVVVGIKRPVKVFIRGRGWLDTNLYIWTEQYFLSLVNRAGEELGRRVTLREPRLNAVLKDGSRIHVAIPPLSNVHSLTVRRFTAKPLTPSHLIEAGLLEARHMAVLCKAMEEGLNVLVAGNTGSGKTTLLNALFGFVPLDERIVAVEEVPELRLPHPHFIRLTPRFGITMRDLIRDTLRMRPDRVVVGEIRQEDEAEAFMETVLAGQGRGSYATIHGRSVEEVRARLRSLGIPEVDLRSIDVVVVLERKGMERRLKELGSFSGALPSPEAGAVEALESIKIYDLEAFARRFGHGC